MAEYQYYDFYSLDRPLNKEEISQIKDLSSRAKVNPQRATFAYHYGDFKSDEVDVLNKHFDMMLYIANWGTRRLLIKVPKALVPKESLKAYECDVWSAFENSLKIQSVGTNLVIDIIYHEESEYWVEGEGMLDDMLPLRAQILESDYRVLYLTWLHLMAQMSPQEMETDKEILEPPLPPNLKRLDPALKSFAHFMQIPFDLINAAAENSPNQDSIPLKDLAEYIPELSNEEKNQYLAQLLADKTKARQSLRQRLMEFYPTQAPKVKPRRTLYELQDAVARQSHLRIMTERKADEAAKIKKMERIRQEKSQMWYDVEEKVPVKKRPRIRPSYRPVKRTQRIVCV
ncbi:MAG: hypothetical protein HC880_12655 [Bacteroidia bacterium]|nr:hypothetical protein [Bacteroidia bacterium]